MLHSHEKPSSVTTTENPVDVTPIDEMIKFGQGMVNDTIYRLTLMRKEREKLDVGIRHMEQQLAEATGILNKVGAPQTPQYPVGVR